MVFGSNTVVFGPYTMENIVIFGPYTMENIVIFGANTVVFWANTVVFKGTHSGIWEKILWYFGQIQ